MSVLTLRPSANGDKVEWAGNGDSPEYACVDEAGSHDGDSTYISYGTAYSTGGALFALPNHTTENGTINKVTLYGVVRATGLLEALGRALIKTHATEYTQDFSGSAVYEAKTWEMTTNPNTGAAWTWAEIDNLQAGVEAQIAGNNQSNELRCTQIYVEVDYTPDSGVTLSPNDLNHNQPLEGSYSLSQKHNLSINALLHDHNLEAVSLSQAVQLIIESLSHGHTAESPTLSQAHQLAVNALSHSHSLDSIALGQAVILVIESLRHEHTADSPTLSQAHQLAVNALSHSHNLGSVSLTEAIQLIISNLEHGHNLDQVNFAVAMGELLLTADSLQPEIRCDLKVAHITGCGKTS